jgi:hypothetical protein
MAVSVEQLSPELVGKVCEESCERMQLAADLLLLETGNTTTNQSEDRKRLSVLEPVHGGNDSYGKLRDAIIAVTKTLSILTKEFSSQMNLRSFENVKALIGKLANQAIKLTEDAANAAYHAALADISCIPAKPGVISRYSFERAKQDLHLSFNRFADHGSQLSTQDVLEISKAFAENIAMLTQHCTRASTNELVGNADRIQFAACSQSLQSATSAFLASLKIFASLRSEGNCKRCLLFGKPLLAVVDSIVEFSSYPQFSGRPAVLSQHGKESQLDILGGAMALTSSCTQLLNTAKSILNEPDKKRSVHLWQKLENCLRAVNDSAKLLSSSTRGHTPMSSRRPSAHFT